MATSAVSRSRISPIITTSGSWRSTLRRALSKLTLSAESTSTWATPGISYSIGSSMVTMFCGPAADESPQGGVERGGFAAAGRAGEQDHAVRLVDRLRKRQARSAGRMPSRSRVSDSVCRASSRSVMRSPYLVGRVATRMSMACAGRAEADG